MAMKSSSTTMKSFYVLFVIMILLTSSQLSIVECRALRSTIADGCDDQAAGGEEGAGSMGVTQFGVASDNNSSSTSGSNGGSVIRSLMFKLASGPSKRGKGH